MTEPPTQPTAAFRASDLLRSKAWLPLLVICALGCTLRLHEFFAWWVNPDEGIYYSMVTWTDWSDFWRECSENAHPPLFYLVLRGMSALAEDFTWLRSISLVTGCLWIPIAFLLTREAAGRDAAGTVAGFVAALLVATSRGAIAAAQVMRPYALLIACLALSFYFAIRYLRTGHRGLLVGYVACGLLALLTHYSAVLAFAAFGATTLVLLIARQLSRRQTRDLLVANAPLVVTVGILYVTHLGHLSGTDMANEARTGWLQDLMFDGFARVWFGLAGTMSAFYGEGREYAGAATMLAGLGIAAWRRNLVVFAFPLIAWLLAWVLAAAGTYPFGCSRHSLYLLPAFVLPTSYLLGFGLGRGWRRAVVTASALAALLVASHLLQDTLATKRIRTDLLTERTIRATDLRDGMEMVPGILAEDGVILMAWEAFYSYLPLYTKPRQRARRAADGSFETFRWGQRDVVVWRKEWRFRMTKDELDSTKHLHYALGHIERLRPDLRITRGRNVILFFGGWWDETPIQLTKRPEIQPLLGRGFGRDGMLLIEFDATKYWQSIK